MMEWALGHRVHCRIFLQSPLQSPISIHSTWLTNSLGHARVENGKFVHEITRNVQQVMCTLVWTFAPKKKLDDWYWYRYWWYVTNSSGSLTLVKQMSNVSSWPSFFAAPWSACAPGVSNQEDHLRCRCRPADQRALFQCADEHFRFGFNP